MAISRHSLYSEIYIQYDLLWNEYWSITSENNSEWFLRVQSIMATLEFFRKKYEGIPLDKV